MKILHLADLHIGKTLRGFSLLEDQRHIFDLILNLIDREKPEAVIIAGDAYDKAAPSPESVSLLDSLLTDINRLGPAIFMISGNHDSPERLEFASRLLEENGIHIYSAFSGEPPSDAVRKVVLNDAYGPVVFHMLPFLRPGMARPCFADREINSYNDGVETVLAANKPDISLRNVILSHQFVISSGQAPLRSESERGSVGGLDSVDFRLFDAYDYVALGHLHCPQYVGRECVRYAGSPLKYSASESEQLKSATMVDLGEKGSINISQLPLTPLRDLRRIKGTLAELMDEDVIDSDGKEDYVYVTLTDEEEIPGALEIIRGTYPNMIFMGYENSRSFAEDLSQLSGTDYISPEDLFVEFYRSQNGKELSKGQLSIVKDILKT